MRKRNLTLGMLAVVFVSKSVVAFAQVEEVGIKLDGLACAFCAYGLEKKLKGLKGVEKLEILVDEGTAKVTARKKETLSVEGIEKAVRDGGYTPREISLTVTGRLSEKKGLTVVTIPDSGDLFLVESNDQLQKVWQKLKGEDKRVRLSGKIVRKKTEGHSGHPFILSVERFQVL